MPERRRPVIALAIAFAILAAPVLAPAPAAAQAREAQPLAADPALELRVMAIAEELRCLVCQNETIAASQADLARDLRAQIRGQLQEGRTPEEVLGFMVARYGEFVLYRPPLSASTLLLWGGPFALLLGAGLWLVLRLRERPRAGGQALSDDEMRRVRQLLDEGTRR